LSELRAPRPARLRPHRPATPKSPPADPRCERGTHGGQVNLNGAHIVTTDIVYAARDRLVIGPGD
jgi:hypothetical protein